MFCINRHTTYACYIINLLAYMFIFQSSPTLWPCIWMTQVKAGFEDLHAYLCSLGRVTSLKVPVLWAVIHLRDSQWTAPALCVSRICERLKVWLFKSQSVREGLGKLQCCGSSNQKPGGSQQHIMPGTRSQETQSPSAWLPPQLLGVLQENQTSHLEAWLKAPYPFVFYFQTT